MGLVTRGRFVVGVLIVAVACALPGDRAEAAGLLVYAHRGDTNPHDGYPENSLEAIAQAAARGADGIEFDVQDSLDGTFWLLHDETVDRTTDGTGRLAAMDDAQIGDLRVDGGLGWRAGMSPRKIARLTNALAAAGPKVHLEVDLKASGDTAARRLGAALEGLGARTTINVKSHAQIAILRAALPGVTIAAQPDWILDALTATDVDVVIVWGDQLSAAQRRCAPRRIELFRNPVEEPRAPDETTLVAVARALELRAILTDDLPVALRARG